MIARTVALASIMVVVLPVAASVEGPEGWAPVAAVALVTGGDVFVAWTPGAEVDAYKVYGVEGSTMALVGVVDDQTSAWVQGGYPHYAVTAIKDNVESSPVVAFTAATCTVSVHHGPPPSVAVGRCLKVHPGLGLVLP